MVNLLLGVAIPKGTLGYYHGCTGLVTVFPTSGTTIPSLSHRLLWPAVFPCYLGLNIKAQYTRFILGVGELLLCYRDRRIGAWYSGALLAFVELFPR